MARAQQFEYRFTRAQSHVLCERAGGVEGRKDWSEQPSSYTVRHALVIYQRAQSMEMYNM